MASIIVTGFSAVGVTGDIAPDLETADLWAKNIVAWNGDAVVDVIDEDDEGNEGITFSIIYGDGKYKRAECGE